VRWFEINRGARWDEETASFVGGTVETVKTVCLFQVTIDTRLKPGVAEKGAKRRNFFVSFLLVIQKQLESGEWSVERQI
jgi:hypothetical protein